MRKLLWMGLLLTLPLFAQTPPQFRVDATWPHELPFDWILGQVSGIAVDNNDHIWIVHRPRSLADTEMGMVLKPPIASCCRPAPSVLEFDADGRFLQSWGGPEWNVANQMWDAAKSPWPENEHGIYVDA